MIDFAHFQQDTEVRKEELIRLIEHAIRNLSAAELEALYYDMTVKGYMK